jgi:imidazolonepropionase
MQNLRIVRDGALLIRNGVIEESGQTQRVENLLKARGAKEIDALGRVVMPAFVDPDAALIAPQAPSSRLAAEAREIPLRVFSKRRLTDLAVDATTAWVRHGVLSVGAHSGYAGELRETTKVLRIHQRLQGKPLRIRSILSPRKSSPADVLIGKWLPAVRKSKLALVLELTAGAPDSMSLEDLRAVAIAASELNYALRLRAPARLDAEICELAAEAGALALVSSAPPLPEYAGRLSLLGSVHVLSAMAAGSGDSCNVRRIRAALDAGAAIALGSGYQLAGPSSFNFQYLLGLARERFGLSDEEAIVAATWNAACSLRMSHVTGGLEPGKKADVLLMDVPDYRDLTRRAGHSDVQMAMRSGQVVYQRAGLTID